MLQIEIMNKFNIGRSTVKDICQSEDNLKLFQMAKHKMGISKPTKNTKTCSTSLIDTMYLSGAILFYTLIQV